MNYDIVAIIGDNVSLLGRFGHDVVEFPLCNSKEMCAFFFLQTAAYSYLHIKTNRRNWIPLYRPSSPPYET